MESSTGKRIHSSELIKSKKRVEDHGEVFTPLWLVEAMLDLTEESDRIDARFLEPACGTGNFLTRILQRKLAIVELKYKKAGNDRRSFALISLMSLYGIELLEDNIAECRNRLLSIFADFLNIGPSDDFYLAATYVLSRNLVNGDALRMSTSDNQPIVFSEWEYAGRGKFRRRDFRLEALASSNDPISTHSPISVKEMAHALSNGIQMEIL